jgi:hypothetical protein
MNGKLSHTGCGLTDSSRLVLCRAFNIRRVFPVVLSNSADLAQTGKLLNPNVELVEKVKLVS